MIKRMTFIVVGLMLLMMSFSSALIITDSSPNLGNTKAYIEETGDYGGIMVTDIYGENIAKYILLNSKNSVIDSYALGKVTLYQSGKIFDGVLFQNAKGQSTSVKDYDVYYYKINKDVIDTTGSNWTCDGEVYSNESYQFNLNFNYSIYVENYTLENNDSNILFPILYNEILYNAIHTNGTQCFPIESSYINYTNGEEKYYDYSPLPVGDYGWRIVAKKDSINQIVDWVISAKQKLFTEWFWWNSLWGRSQNISMDLSSNVGQNVWVKVQIPQDSSYNNADWSDSRFVLNGNELQYSVPQVSSGYADFLINIEDVPSGNFVIQHYYNSSVTQTTGIDYSGSYITPTTSISSGVSVSNIEAFVTTNDNKKFNSEDFTINCEADSSFGVDKIALYIDGNQQASKTISNLDTVTTDFLVNGINNGAHTYYCVADDSQGSATSEINHFELDKTNPSVKITNLVYDESDKNLPVSVAIFLDISDTNLDKCYYKINDKDPQIPFDCGDDLSLNIDNYGIYTITVYAEDTFGLIGSTISSQIKIADLDPPTIMVSSPRGTVDLLNSTILLHTITNEKATCSYVLNDGSQFKMNQSKDGLSQEAVISPSTSKFNLKFVCEDVYGNKAETYEKSYDWFYYKSSGVSNITLNSIDIKTPLVLSKGTNVIKVDTLSQTGELMTIQNLDLKIAGQTNYTISEIRTVAGQVGVYEIEFILPEYSLDSLDLKVTANDGEKEISKSVNVKYSSNSVVKGFSGLAGNMKSFFSEGRWIILVVVISVVFIIVLLTKKQTQGEKKYERQKL